MADILYLMGFKTPPAVGAYETEGLDLTDPSAQHVTLLDCFALPTPSLPAFIADMFTVARWFESIPLEKKGLEFFGDLGQIPVMTLRKDPRLLGLHESAYDLLRKHEGEVKTPDYTGTGYAPHVSFLEDETELWTMSHLSLIHHRGGFGVDVVNYGNMPLGS